MIFRHVLAKLNQLFPVSVPSIFLGNGEVTHVRLPSHKRLLLQTGAARGVGVLNDHVEYT